jgi:hypothetical protein
MLNDEILRPKYDFSSKKEEKSRAFKRYRNIEDETLKSVINLIG